MGSVQQASGFTSSEHTLQNQFVGILIAGLIIDVVAVGLRSYMRRRSDSGLGTDDAFLVASLGPLIAYVVASLVIHKKMVDEENATHTPATGGAPPAASAQAKVFVEGFIVCMISYAINTALVKLSLLWFYCRIFQTRTLNRLAWGLSAVIVMYNLALILVAALQCLPLSTAWTDGPGKCINLDPPLLVLGIVNVVMDFTILSIPIRFISRLNMSFSRKIQVCGIFLTGAIVCVFSILRVTAVGTVTQENRIYAELWSGVVSYTEMFVGVLATCLPSFGKFFKKETLLPLVRSGQLFLSKTFCGGSGRFERQSSDSIGKEMSSTGLSVSNPKSPTIPHAREVVNDDEDDELDMYSKKRSPASA